MNCSNIKTDDVLFALSQLAKKDKISQLTMTIRPWKYGDYSAATVTIEYSDDTETQTYSTVWQNMSDGIQGGLFLPVKREEGEK